jgi:hypothetical protein
MCGEPAQRVIVKPSEIQGHCCHHCTLFLEKHQIYVSVTDHIYDVRFTHIAVNIMNKNGVLSGVEWTKVIKIQNV